MKPEPTQFKWSEIYRANREQLFVAAMSILGQASLAEDAIHDAFLKITAKQPVCSHPKTYAFQCVRNSAIEILRRRQRIGEPGSSESFEPIHLQIQPDSFLVESNEVDQQVVQALSEIEPNSREIIVLHLNSELTFREIAKTLEIPLGTVATRYRRGIKKMRTILNSKMTEQNHD